MRRATPRLELVLLVFWGLFIVYGTTLPFDLSSSRETFSREWSQAHKIPWRHPDGGLPPLPDAAANFLLFLPWGFLLSLHFARRGSSAARAIALGGVTAFGLSLFVETLQLFSPSRMTSSTDLTTNTLGGIVGASAGWILGARLRVPLGALVRRELGRRPRVVLAGLVAVLTIGWALSPYDLSFDPDYLKNSLKLTRPVPFGPPLRGSVPAENPLERASELFAWCLVGGVIAHALRGERGWTSRRRVQLSVVLTIALAIGTEVIQLFVRSRTTDATTILFASLGGAAGALLAFALVRERAAIRAAALVWLAATLAAGLAPGGFAWPEALPKLGRLLPFIHHFVRTDVHALSDAMFQILFYAPLGFLVGSREIRGGAWRIATAAGAVALFVESVQLFLPARTADLTDVVLAAMGGVAGAWIRRRAREEIASLTPALPREAREAQAAPAV